MIARLQTPGFCKMKLSKERRRAPGIEAGDEDIMTLF